MTDASPKFINISERAYKYIRQFTIKSLQDGLIELITNSVDAYRRTDVTDRLILIDIVDNTTAIVTDNALGLTSSQLDTCFLQVGNYTASDGSRGFFSRGAKDISALGNVYFNTIKNDKYSQCMIDSDAYGSINISDVDATQDIRSTYGIPYPNNGLSVSISLLPMFQNIDIDNLYEILCNTGVLRDINADSKNNIILRSFTNGVQTYNSRITYSYPKSVPLLDIQYIVPNYPDVTARFVVNKSSKPIPQPKLESELEFGFLVKDSTSIYEVNTIDNKYRWNPYINYIYGYLECDAIKQYLMDYDINGPTEKNPYPIIDPSRLSGLNKIHPLIINLMSIPLVRVDMILRELNGKMATQSITLTDINDLLDELTKFGLDLLKDDHINVTFTPSYDQNLIKAVQDDRANYVISEVQYQINNNLSIKEETIDNYIKDQIINITGMDTNTPYFVMNDDNELVQLQSIANGEYNDPINILRLMNEQHPVNMNNYPYIYSINGSRNLIKLYIFQKGFIDNYNMEKNINISQKLLNIVFINDVNMPQRYVIDNTNGITIKLNLNNPMIKKYLTDDTSTRDLSGTISIDSFSWTQNYIFLKELIGDILTNLITTNDMTNGKLMVDNSDGVIAVQKILDYKNAILTDIEVVIDNVFQRYIDNNVNNKMKTITSSINLIKDAIGDNPDIHDMMNDLSNVFNNVIE